MCHLVKNKLNTLYSPKRPTKTQPNTDMLSPQKWLAVAKFMLQLNTTSSVFSSNYAVNLVNMFQYFPVDDNRCWIYLFTIYVCLGHIMLSKEHMCIHALCVRVKGLSLDMLDMVTANKDLVLLFKHLLWGIQYILVQLECTCIIDLACWYSGNRICRCKCSKLLSIEQ